MARNDEQQIPDDEYARRSFTFRRMTKGQVRTISIVSALIVVALILYTLV